MTKEDYDKTQAELLELAQGIADAKRPGYTQASVDVLHNFKTVALLVGISPLQVWAVYYLKHVQAVLAHAMNPEIKQGEPLQGRFADLINYTLLGHAIYGEAENANAEASTGTSPESLSDSFAGFITNGRLG